MSDILGDMLEDLNLKVTYLVINALNKCIINLLKLLNFIVCISSGRVKWLLTSWNEITIKRKLRSDDTRIRLSLELKVNVIQVSYTVKAYINVKLSGLKSL